MSVFMRTRISLIDNSGVRLARIVKVYKHSVRSGGSLGDIVLVSIYSFSRSHHNIKNKLYPLLITGVRRWTKRCNGVSLRFFTNYGALLTDRTTLVGTRFYKPISNESYFYHSKEIEKLQKIIERVV